MAVVSIPLLGQASGKMSNFEFFRILGKNCIRSSKLKRYKSASPLQLQKQLLLKKIVASISPLFFLMKSSLFIRRNRLNYFCAWLKKYYHNFYLNESNYLFCNNYRTFQFSRQDLELVASFSIDSYDSSSLYFNCTSNIDFSADEWILYAILISNQFRASCYFPCEQLNPEATLFQIAYGAPPFHSANYSCLVFAYNVTLNKYTNTLFAFDFSH